MTLPFSLRIALRYLWASRADAAVWVITLIAILGVAIGVIVLNITMSVFTGFQTELRSKILGTDAHIFVRSIGGSLDDWKVERDDIKAVQGIRSISPFTQHQALIKNNDRAVGLLIRGLEEGTESAKQLESYLESPDELKKLFHPDAVDDVNLPGILIGNELARNLGAFPGATVSILSPEVSSSPFGLLPRFRRFVVVGIYKSGLVEYESGLAYVSLTEAQSFFRTGSAVTGLEVRVDDIDAAPAISKVIMQKLNGLSKGLYAQDWTLSNKPFFDAMKLEQRVYFIVLLLIIVIASFSIVSSLIMVVLEKRKDIAILKTLGASRFTIGTIFRLQGAVIGFVGVFSGTIGAYIGCKILDKYGFPIDERIFQMSTLPIKMDAENFFIVGMSAFIICCLSTIYPAARASNLEPSDVLRYE